MVGAGRNTATTPATAHVDQLLSEAGDGNQVAFAQTTGHAVNSAAGRGASAQDARHGTRLRRKAQPHAGPATTMPMVSA